MFTLRQYQQNACDAALGWIKSSIDPCMIDAAPAAGKSFMVAYLAINIRVMAAVLKVNFVSWGKGN